MLQIYFPFTEQFGTDFFDHSMNNRQWNGAVDNVVIVQRHAFSSDYPGICITNTTTTPYPYCPAPMHIDVSPTGNSDGHITFTSSPALSGGNGYTISLWYRAGQLLASGAGPPYNNFIYTLGSSGNVGLSANHFLYICTLANTNFLDEYCVTYQGVGGGVMYTRGQMPLQYLNQWHHIVFTLGKRHSRHTKTELICTKNEIYGRR